ncbi:hypothetical protein [Furfurilactobacillus rossiae]|uniref:Uncharacterized protein n=1 Tax=Furfurilactobacillus rossiae DSM 15814 TaxID=1114972 RepID=A0A0R1RTW6_9LACO|nr:hypothetical protein [Furfurilactobacillus rossiae]KRL56659.1 hypothetical protein FD35_GL001758 [Furfurilactobacillus rossiae DSM 15814]QFR66440.1 hypothetical protein LR814_04735 [Furfurilactobacillus rossiae]QLE61897.1 hypothetical protein LROSRS0_1852 [Furfurilactobacillus rossiae]
MTDLMKFLFVDVHGKFEWIGITSVLAIVTLTYNAWDRRRQFRADLISKSRIKWMEQVRPLVANFYTDSKKYIFDRLHANTKSQTLSIPELNNNLVKVQELYTQIILFTPDNESNELLLHSVKLVWGEIDNMSDYADLVATRKISKSKLQAVNDYMMDLFNNGVKQSSKYFKLEWDRAKAGE